MNKKKIAINGFGRIGRLFFRQIFGDPEIEVAAINDLGDINNLAYLLQHDTVYRNFDKSVSVQDGNLVVDGQTVKILQVKDPAQLPWKDLGIDIAVEATGFFEEYAKAKSHLDAGAKRVDMDQYIPPELYLAVAELLAWLYQIEHGGQAAPSVPLTLPGSA